MPIRIEKTGGPLHINNHYKEWGSVCIEYNPTGHVLGWEAQLQYVIDLPDSHKPIGGPGAPPGNRDWLSVRAEISISTTLFKPNDLLCYRETIHLEEFFPFQASHGTIYILDPHAMAKRWLLGCMSDPLQDPASCRLYSTISMSASVVKVTKDGEPLTSSQLAPGDTAVMGHKVTTDSAGYTLTSSQPNPDRPGVVEAGDTHRKRYEYEPIDGSVATYHYEADVPHCKYSILQVPVPVKSAAPAPAVIDPWRPPLVPPHGHRPEELWGGHEFSSPALGSPSSGAPFLIEPDQEGAGFGLHQVDGAVARQRQGTSVAALSAFGRRSDSEGRCQCGH